MRIEIKEKKKKKDDQDGNRLWVPVKFIGKGGFGSVEMAKTSKNHTFLPPIIAVKTSQVPQSIMHEGSILSKLKHCPFVIRYYGDDCTDSKEEGRLYHLLLEYASKGSLADRINECRKTGSRLSVDEIRNRTCSILKGLWHIHRHGYIHCDMKPANILICEDGSTKIADFGLSLNYKHKKDNVDYGTIGTHSYMAPESIISHEYTPQCDVWALGCVVFEMFTNERLWPNKPKNLPDELYESNHTTHELSHEGIPTTQELYEGIHQLPAMPDWVSDEGKYFIYKCLARDPKVRWTVDRLMKHQFCMTNEKDKEEENTYSSPFAALHIR